jgi:hypothetical protein
MTIRDSLSARAGSLWCAAAASAVAAAALVACGGGGGGTASTAPDASLRMAMTDAPSCGYDHVWVTVTKVGVNMSASAQDSDSGWTDITLASPKRIDLLGLTNGVLEELGQTPLKSGSYNQIRLVLAANDGTTPIQNAVQPTGGAETALTTPSGQQSGLKLQAHFDVAAGQTADLVLDFDACRSVVTAGSGKYLLKPVISVVPRSGTAITGYVGTTMPLASTTVSAQVDGATVRSTAPDPTTGAFSIPFLAAGTYNVVVTSDGHASAVVTGVATGTSTTAINGTATAIVTPASNMADVTGAVTAAQGNGASANTNPVTDATVTASQALTGGPTVLIASQPVDATVGTYRLRLPVGAPVKASWSTGTTTLTFSPDAAVAGKYAIGAQAPNRTPQTKSVDVSSGAAATVDFGY